MPIPPVVNHLVRRYLRFPQISCKFAYYCVMRSWVVKEIKRRAYRTYSRKKMYRRRFFQYLRRKWLTNARGALAVKKMSPLLLANSRANVAKGRGHANTPKNFTTFIPATPNPLSCFSVESCYETEFLDECFEIPESVSTSES